MGNEQDNEQGTPSYSRGSTGPMGKYTEVIKTHVDERTFMDLLRLCHVRNTNPSELLRAAVYLVLYGKTPEQMVADAQGALMKPLLERLEELRQ